MFLVKVEVKHQKMVGRMMLEVEVGQMSTLFRGGLMQVENKVKMGHLTSCQAIYMKVAEKVEDHASSGVSGSIRWHLVRNYQQCQECQCQECQYQECQCQECQWQEC